MGFVPSGTILQVENNSALRPGWNTPVDAKTASTGGPYAKADRINTRRRVPMKKMLGSVVATALCAVSLCAISAPRAHAANPKVIYTGQIQDDFQVIVVGVDGAKNVDVN